MARRGRKSDEGSSAAPIENARPDVLDGLLDPLPALPSDPVSSLDDFMQPLIPNDQRLFSFGDPERYTLDVGQTANSIGVERPTRLPAQVRFADPAQVAICVRRKERREVLHALRYVRKGKGGSRRRNWASKIKC